MRFGLIGVGGVGALRRAALKRSSGATLAAATDLDAARLSGLPAAVRRFPSAEELLRADLCDAVIISTRPDSHEELVLAALAAGKHVLVEKPMAPGPDACRRLLRAAADSGRVLTVGFNHRYFAAVKLVREAVRAGAIGRLSHVKGYAGHVGLAEFPAPWMYDPRVVGGGTLWDNGIHVIDLVRHLVGEVVAVSGAVGGRVWQLEGTEDNGFALLHAADGVTGTLHASWTAWQGYGFHIEAYGDRGMARAAYAPMRATLIILDRPGGRRKVSRHFYPGAILREKVRGWQSTAVQTFGEELGDFIRLAEGRDGGTIARAEDGVRAVEIAAAVRESAAGERRVRLATLG